MGLETVTNYIANSVNLDGVRAEQIKKALQADVLEELAHAQWNGVDGTTRRAIQPGTRAAEILYRSSQSFIDHHNPLSIITILYRS